MTKEEAIKIINCYDIGFYDLSGEKIPADKLAEAFDMAIEALKERPKGKWIPCSERLPLHGSRVLVTATHKKLGHTAVDVLRYHGDEYGWEGSDICIVTAWMPLPEAMKEGESNG